MLLADEPIQDGDLTHCCNTLKLRTTLNIETSEGNSRPPASFSFFFSSDPTCDLFDWGAEGGGLWVKAGHTVHRGAVLKASTWTSSVSRVQRRMHEKSPESVLWRRRHMNNCILTHWHLQKPLLEKKTAFMFCHISLKSWRGHGLLELFGAHVCVYVLLHWIKLWPDQPRPLPLPPLEIKNIKTLKQEIRKKTKLSAILFYGGEVDMSAQWDPASNKDQHFFHCFSFWWQWTWFKDQKKQNSFQIWYIYGSVTFFQFFLFFF